VFFSPKRRGKKLIWNREEKEEEKRFCGENIKFLKYV
jgi:hypothetical protein